MLRDLLESRVALCAMQVQYVQHRREALRLVTPVVYEGGGHDNQRGLSEPAGLLFGEKVRERLQRLAQAHVVGQHAGEVVSAQELHPGEPLTLIL